VIVHRLDRRRQLDHPIDAGFAFFAEADNLERISDFRRQAVQRHLEER
jgi:hypothetical protein